MSRPTAARCVCGLRLRLHFTPDNRKLSCADAAKAHPYAGARRVPLAQALWAVLKVQHG